jgi:hypothetical protein
MLIMAMRYVLDFKGLNAFKALKGFPKNVVPGPGKTVGDV